MKQEELKLICENDGYRLLEYNNAKNVIIEDKDGYKYNTNVGSIVRHMGHNILQHNKFALENLKRYVLKKTNSTVSILSTEYVDCKSPVKFICSKHNDYIQESTAEQIINSNTICRYCRAERSAERQAVDANIVQAYIQAHNGRFDHIEIIGHNTRVYYFCNDHIDKGLQSCNWYHLQHRKCICRYCSGRGLSPEEYNSVVQSLNPNIELLSDYVGYDKRMKCRCKVCGHVWSTRAGQLKSSMRPRGCPVCGQKRAKEAIKYTKEEFQERLAQVNPSIIVVGEYLGAHKLIECRCNLHNISFSCYPSNLLNKSATCPECAGKIGKSEKVVGDTLRLLSINYIPQYSFNDCRGKKRSLPFDYYLPEYNVAIEYDGEQHFMPVDIFGGLKKFEQQKVLDSIKDQYCIDNHITLIRIPYTEKHNIREYLTEQLSALVKTSLLEPERLTGCRGNTPA